jgi:hypothetical protein
VERWRSSSNYAGNRAIREVAGVSRTSDHAATAGVALPLTTVSLAAEIPKDGAFERAGDFLPPI